MDIEIIQTKRTGWCDACAANGMTTQGPLAKVSITINGVSVPTFAVCHECRDLLKDFA
jgi:hypothetical protein